MSSNFLDLSLGIIEVGILVATLLYGISLVQTYIYFTSSGDDTAFFKVIVLVLCICETFQTIFTWMYLFNLTVTRFGDPLALFQLPWYICLSVTFQALAGGIVQVFYAWRVYLVSRKWWLVPFPITGALIRTISGILMTAFTIRAGSIYGFRAQYNFVVFLSGVSSAAADVWNTTTLCWYLGLQRNVQNTRTLHLIDRIMMWAIETGMMTSMTAVLIVAFWVTMPENGLWLAALIIYGKLYSNSLLVSFNSRRQRNIPDSWSAPVVALPLHSSRTLEVEHEDKGNTRIQQYQIDNFRLRGDRVGLPECNL